MVKRMDTQGIIAFFDGMSMDAASRLYLKYHANRFSFLLGLLEDCIGTMAGGTCESCLDVGPNYLTVLLRECGIASRIDSIGFHDDRFPCRAGDAHFEFDLRNTVLQERWPRIGPYDLVVMAEVIEHLPVHLPVIFAFLASLVKPGGHLVVQTPNACSLSKRMSFLMGRNPFDLIRDDRENPGHFREYTIRELTDHGVSAGFGVRRATTRNYFSGERLRSKALARVSPLLPASLRNGITLWLVRE